MSQIIGISKNLFAVGLILVILVSTVLSVGIATQLLVKGPKGDTGATGIQGPVGPQGPAGSSTSGTGTGNQAEYTTVQVFSDNVAHATLGGYTYTFLYKWSLHTLDPQNPIEVQVAGLSKTLPAKVGTYNVLSIEVVVSEVNDDYVILKVRQP